MLLAAVAAAAASGEGEDTKTWQTDWLASGRQDSTHDASRLYLGSGGHGSSSASSYLVDRNTRHYDYGPHDHNATDRKDLHDADGMSSNAPYDLENQYDPTSYLADKMGYHDYSDYDSRWATDRYTTNIFDGYQSTSFRFTRHFI